MPAVSFTRVRCVTAFEAPRMDWRRATTIAHANDHFPHLAFARGWPTRRCICHAKVNPPHEGVLACAHVAPSSCDDADHLNSAVAALARMHAKWWQHPKVRFSAITPQPLGSYRRRCCPLVGSPHPRILRCPHPIMLSLAADEAARLAAAPVERLWRHITERLRSCHKGRARRTLQMLRPDVCTNPEVAAGLTAAPQVHLARALPTATYHVPRRRAHRERLLRRPFPGRVRGSFFSRWPSNGRSPPREMPWG